MTSTFFFIWIADISLDVPDDLDLSSLRGQGLQPGEEELPQEIEAPPGKYNEKYSKKLPDSNLIALYVKSSKIYSFLSLPHSLNKFIGQNQSPHD